MIKFGILGYGGSIGSRHGKNLMYLGHQVIGFDPAVKGKHSREEVLGMADAIIICTPTREHFRDMVDAHHKHILVEKPVAFDAPPSAVRGFMQGKSSMGEVVAVGNNLRFHESVIKTKNIIDSGEIGKVGWAEFWVNQKTEKPLYLMDGVSRNWGAHEIDLALYLLGPAVATEITKLTLADDNDVEMACSLQHENGAFTSIHMDYLTEPEKRGYKIVGSKGVIEVDLFARTVKCGDNQWKMTDTYDENYLAELKEFIHCVDMRAINKNSPLASGNEGAATLDIILSLRSMAGLKDKEINK